MQKNVVKALNQKAMWYMSERALPYWSILVLDCAIVLVTMFCSCILGMGLLNTMANQWAIVWTLLLYLLCYLVGFRVMQTYMGVMRMASFSDLKNLAIALTIGASLTLIAKFGIDAIPGAMIVRYRALIMTFAYVTILCSGMRIFVRTIFDSMMQSKKQCEELLPREQIEIDTQAIGQLLSDKIVLITGAAGSIGSEIVRQIAEFHPRRLILVDQAETPMHDICLELHKKWPFIQSRCKVASISDEGRMRNIFQHYCPDYVFHAAAYKHVPMMEENPSEAVSNNIVGTRIIADLAVETGVKKFVMVSTDKAVNPTNVMGCSKRICEMYVQALSSKESIKTQFITTRFGNVLGSNGSVIPLFKQQIRQGGPVTVTHPDITRYFMLIPEACKLVLEAGTMGKGGEIFIFDMGEPVRIADLAKRMINLSGRPDIEIEYTGLRPGEKLYEEVLNPEEIERDTNNPKIHVARVRQVEWETVNDQIDKLVEITKRHDDMATVKQMKIMVPEYKSQNSRFEDIDKEINNINL